MVHLSVMKINSTLTLIAFIVVFLLGILLGFNIKSTQSGENPINLNPSPKSCQYNGKTYKSGEGFKDKDGCNSCSCEDGKVACTLVACE